MSETGPAERDAARHAVQREWRAETRRKRRNTVLLGALLAGLFFLSAMASEFNPALLPEALLSVGEYFSRMAPEVGSRGVGGGLSAWFWAAPRWGGLLLDTLAIAFLATLWAFVGAAVLSVFASPNLWRFAAVRFVVLRLLEAARTVPEMVFALVFVVAFGLGPLAGILALGVHSLGALGKLFAAVNQNIDMGPVTSLRAVGATLPRTVRFAVFPQVLPSYLSYTLLRLETNVRSASVIGLVGVGGIGQELYYAVRQFLYADVGAMLLMLVATVSVLDVCGEQLRRRLGAGELSR